MQRVQCASTSPRSPVPCWATPFTQSAQICRQIVPAGYGSGAPVGPWNFHGKEGVDGSSPSEGFRGLAGILGRRFRVRLARGSVASPRRKVGLFVTLLADDPPSLRVVFADCVAVPRPAEPVAGGKVRRLGAHRAVLALTVLHRGECRWHVPWTWRSRRA